MAQELFQGPPPPGCIGSIFGTRQLESNPQQLGSPLFDRPNGNPRELLSTGCKLQLFDDPFIHPVEQSGYMYEDGSIQYAPVSLVNDMLREDMIAKIALVHGSNQIFGNRLECLKCNDGKLQLVFPVGKNVHSIGSMYCQQDESGQLSPVKEQDNEDNDLTWPNGVRMCISPSLFQPIRQLSALQVSGSRVDESLILARTAYQIHVVNMQKEDDRVCFASRSVTTHRKGVSHVTWNPHVQGEVAAVLETGEVFIYDIQSVKSYTNNLHASFVLDNDLHNRSYAEKTEDNGRLTKAFASEVNNLRDSWWRCEYTWNPRVLIVANENEIASSDLRSNDRTVLATVDSTKNFCYLRCQEDIRFMAFNYVNHCANDESVYHFVSATKEHILLFDVRRPRSPLLLWEHHMQSDAPGFLSVYPLSSLRGRSTSAAGKVIMATSFRSGDVRTFCYGPQPPTSAIIPGASTRFQEIEDAYCAWEFPSKLFTCQFRTRSWKEDVYDPFAASLTSKPKESASISSNKLDLDCAECLSGIALVPNIGNRDGFSLLQLTGSGEILSEFYTPSKSLTRYPPRCIEPHGVLGKKKNAVTYRTLPALLNYVRHGITYTQESPHTHKKQKTSDEEYKGKYQELVHKALDNLDIPLSIFELEFRVLKMGLRADLEKLTASMPTNIKGYTLNRSRLPYMLPPVNYLTIEETPVPLPLPVTLEMENGTRNGNYFKQASEIVKEVTSDLRRKQEENILSLSQDENEMKSLFFRSSLDNNGSSTNSDSRYNSFVGSQPSVEESSSSAIFGVPPIELVCKLSEEYELGEIDKLTSLQQDFAKWQQSFAPYVNYCKTKNMI